MIRGGEEKNKKKKNGKVGGRTGSRREFKWRVPTDKRDLELRRGTTGKITFPRIYSH